MESLITGMLAARGETAAVSFDDFVLRMLVALLVGQLIAWVYSRAHGGLSYSQTFVQAIVLLSMVVAVIMLVVGDSLARAFGLGAALAIVRFRTPIKDARDTAFLFLAVASGMAAGAGQLVIALGGSVLICSTAAYLHWISFGARLQEEGLLRFQFSGAADDKPQLDVILRKYCSGYKLSGVRTGSGTSEELIYDVDLKNERAASDLVQDLTRSGLATSITLLPLARVQET